jgi:Glycosyl transferases group 1
MILLLLQTLDLRNISQTSRMEISLQIDRKSNAMCYPILFRSHFRILFPRYPCTRDNELLQQSSCETRNALKIAGDDIHVSDQMIKEKCQNTDGLVEYIGLVDKKTKTELIKGCKAVIACPKPTWIEAFGLYAVEANAYGKPVLALANGGLNDIIVNQTNGFLAKTYRVTGICREDL